MHLPLSSFLTDGISWRGAQCFSQGSILPLCLDQMLLQTFLTVQGASAVIT
jgi:hypothetical protein